MVTIPDNWDEALDHILAQMDTLGPQAIEDAKAEEARRYQRDRAMVVAIRRTFKSQHGQRTLAWLAHMTIRRLAPTGEDLMAMTADQRDAQAMFRAGQNDVFNMIIAAIGQANQTEGGETDD